MKKSLLLLAFASLSLFGCTVMVPPSQVISKGVAFEFNSSKSALNMEGCIINGLRQTVLIKPTSARVEGSSRVYGELMEQLVIVVDISEAPNGSIVKYYKDFSYVLASEEVFEKAVKSCQ